MKGCAGHLCGGREASKGQNKDYLGSRHPAAGGVRRAETQANWTDDVREKIDGPQIQRDVTKVEVNDPRYLSCLSVVPLVMDAT